MPLALTLALALSLATGLAGAQGGGDYQVRWSTLESGGATSLSAGDYLLGGTAGQPEVGLCAAGDYALIGGFWFIPVPSVVGVGDPGLPVAFRVQPVAPNPFAATTRLGFDLPREARVSVEVFDLMGKRVRSLLEARLPAGRHRVEWGGADASGRAVADGIYFVRVQAGRDVATTKVVRAR